MGISQVQFNLRYPILAQFMRETSWKCGDSWIPVTSKCYKDPVTGEVNTRKVKNPKTGRVKTVKVGVDYKTYRRERAEAFKKVNKLIRSNPNNKKPTPRELKLFNDVFDLKERSRSKFVRDKNQKLLNNSLKAGKSIDPSWRDVPVSKGARDRSADMLRSAFKPTRAYSDAVYKVGENVVDLDAVQFAGRTKAKIIRETNLLDIFKAKKIDFDAVDPDFYNVNFKVNDYYSASSSKIKPLEGKSLIQTNIKITQAAAKAHSQVAESLPDNSILYNTPFLSDGKGLGREKLYRRIGYGTLEKTGTGISQAMVKIGKKIYPLAKKIKK